MRKIIVLMLLMTGLVFLFATCHAADNQASVDKIIVDNDRIIKKVHGSGGFVFATPPYWGRQRTKAGFLKLAKHLGKHLKKQIALVILKDYDSMISRTKAGEVDFGFYGASLYVNAKAVYPDLKYTATVILKSTGKHTYYSYLITKKGSGLKSIESLKEKSFAFGSKESTSGYKYPVAWMKKNKISPEHYFGTVAFLGSHNNVLAAVASGKIDAGVVSPEPLADIEKAKGFIFNRLRKFGPIPGTVLALNGSLSEEILEKTRLALLSLSCEVIQDKNFNFTGFKILSDASYDQLRQVLGDVF